MRLHPVKILAVLTCVLALWGCKNGNKKALLPNVSGKAGEVLVALDREQWEGNLGVAIREALASDTPYLAQREPLFTLSNVPPGSFNNMFKMHRNLLLVNVLGVSVYVSTVIAAILVIVGNYIISKLLVFRKKEES